jgi:alkylhydroperoxidase family enzyme
MLDWLIRRRLAAFEKQYGYDTSYARALLAATRKGFFHYARVSAMAQHRDLVPLQPWYAAKVVAARSEDCGPCTQLAVDMARQAGVGDDVLRAVLRDDFAAMSPDVSLAVRYAEAAIAHAPELADLRDEVVQRWGERGLASLALTITATRMFPMLKYALGHGQACQRVRVGSEAVQPAAARVVSHAAA